MKELEYQRQKTKVINNIHNKSSNQFLNISSPLVDKKSLLEIFKIKDYSLEREKNDIFKRVHCRFFTKPKAIIKTCEEMDQNNKMSRGYEYTFFIDRYAGMKNEECDCCKMEVETERHLFTFECPMFMDL